MNAPYAFQNETDEPAIGPDVIRAFYSEEIEALRSPRTNEIHDRDIVRAEWSTAVRVLKLLGVTLTRDLSASGETWFNTVPKILLLRRCREWGIALEDEDGRLAPAWAYIAMGLAGSHLDD